MKATNLQSVMRCAAVLTACLIFMSAAQAASKYKVLHYFGDRPAAAPVGGLVFDSAGNIYGTTQLSNLGVKCGNLGCGVVFELTKESGGAWKYGVLHRFTGLDGAAPVGTLTLDSSGNVYGTTYDGGAHRGGTVFELSPSGGIWKERVLHSFGAGSSDINGPEDAVFLDANGNLFGTTLTGGTNNQGGVFELEPSGGQWKETVIDDFTGGTDGGEAVGDLVSDSSGNLYGVTFRGGQNNVGVVFELTPSGGGWKEAVLYSFAGGSDGASPIGGLVFDSSGNLYGTTSAGGGSSGCSSGCGTVYRLSPSGGTWTESVLHSFNGSDGANLIGRVVFDSASNLYGVASRGGQKNVGVVYKLTPSGNTWTESVLHSFNKTKGATPIGELILDQNGVIYGTANAGGLGGYPGDGVVFSITP